ncbi:hypothetical protein ACDX78_21035 [Virgibacillus oceani]
MEPLKPRDGLIRNTTHNSRVLNTPECGINGPYEVASATQRMPIDLPHERMEHYFADDTRYGTQLSPSDEWPSGIRLVHENTEFEIGEYERNWNKQAIQPDIAAGSSPVYREDGNLEVSMYEDTNSYGYHSMRAPDANPVVYENGKLVEETDRPTGTLPLTSDESEIMLALETDSDKAWSPYSSYTLTNWNVVLEEPEADEQYVAPMLYIL